MKELLAKSRPRLSLVQHTRDVLSAAEQIFGRADQPTRLGNAWLRFFKMASSQWASFHLNLAASCVFHDWGKANDAFQALASEAKGEQTIRHEHLSTLLLGLESVTKWLTGCRDLDLELVLSAVLTHHLKADRELARRYSFGGRLSQQRMIRVFHDHPDFAQLVNLARDTLDLPPAVNLFSSVSPFWGFRNDRGDLRPGVFDLENHREKLKHGPLRALQVAIREDGARFRLLRAVRAALIAADAAGSGLVRVGQDLPAWISAVFNHKRLCDGQFIWREVINKRVGELEAQGKWTNGWSEFQTDCDGLPDRTLLLAPCGAGKTLAAWRWIAARLSERPAGGVLFLYPTRATAKEGFRDYVSWAPNADAALMHGTSAYDLTGMFENPDDPRHESRYEVDRRLYALGFWTRRIFSATVDQFLAFLQYGYGPVCMLPVLADAVVVIDEVHSFDRNMFAALKDFLNEFDVPVLCMTATLPQGRQEELKGSCGLHVYDKKRGELDAIARAPRYRVRRISAAEAPNVVRAALVSGKRVLWVVNQVRRAQLWAVRLAVDFEPSSQQLELHAGPGVPLSCYHSRFKLNDRVARHNAVVGKFRAGDPPAVAITTQVCEMSLDLDADLLVTEDCPITACIQRMGRCNRQRSPRPLIHSGEVFVYAPDEAEPYDKGDMTGFSEFLEDLVRREAVSQADLEAALASAPPPPALGDPLCSFLNSGPYAVAGEESFRDVEEFNRPAVLQGDLKRFIAADPAHQPGFVLPAPARLTRAPDSPDLRLPAYIRVAADACYHSGIGYCDRPIDQMKEGW